MTDATTRALQRQAASLAREAMLRLEAKVLRAVTEDSSEICNTATVTGLFRKASSDHACSVKDCSP